MSRRTSRLLCLAGGFLFAFPHSMSLGQVEGKSPTSLYDARLGELRRASVVWDQSRGPERKVVDQVVLVPDVAAFFEAIASWDDGHFFPILIDDAELAPKFVRAFHPAKILRFPGHPKKAEGRALWNQAVTAVGRGWSRELPNPPEPPDDSGSPGPGQRTSTSRRESGSRGDMIPRWLAPTPPGVVVSNPASPSLAGAVALAAGRFQPLLLWEPAARLGTPLNQQEALQLCGDLETQLSDLVKDFGLLGDDCDFVTLAAPYPDRYNIGGGGFKSGPASFDDLIGRDRESQRRWAYVGRLSGDAPESVYRAMCSLFLQPKSSLLFDSYGAADPGFRGFAMKSAALKLPGSLPSTLVDGTKPDIRNWLRVMGRINEFDLVYVNTAGGPTHFDFISTTTRGYTADIPASVPSIVLLNHSYSAASPDDPSTIAGAWLAGGSYVYFGSMNEPFIAAFRTPSLVASLLGEGLPIAAVVRMGPDENPTFGTPWRLHLLGDPLFRFDPQAAKAPRWASLENTESWPVYSDEPPPVATASPIAQLAWAAKTTLLDAAKSASAPPREAVELILLGIRRDVLPLNVRPILDDLRIDALPRSKDHAGEYLEALAAVPKSESTPSLAMTVLHGRFAKFRRAVDRADWSVMLPLWEEIERSTAPVDLKEYITKDVGALASKSSHLVSWKGRLNALLEGKPASPENKHLRDELARIQQATGKAAAPSIRRGG